MRNPQFYCKVITIQTVEAIQKSSSHVHVRHKFATVIIELVWFARRSIFGINLTIATAQLSPARTIAELTS